MQAKVLYLFITLVCLSCLFGQQADDNLKLSDIEVIGKSKAFSDSVQKLEDDHALTGKTNLSAFSYIPHLEPVFFTEQVTYEKKVTQAFIQLLAGSDAFLKSSLMLVSDDYKLLKLKAGIQQTEFNDNFKNSGYSLSWLPEFRGYNTVISFENQKAEFLSTDQNMETEISYLVFHSPEFEIIDKNSDLLTSSIDFSFDQYRQNWLNNNSEITNSQIAGNFNLKWQKKSLSTGITAQFQKDQIQTVFEFGIKDKICQYSALWLTADKQQIYPSIKYSQYWLLGNNFSMLLQNDPIITSFDRFQLFESNHYLDLDQNHRQVKSPLNHFISLKYETDFYAALSWNSQYLMDKHSIILDPGSSPFYKTAYQDLWKNMLSLSLAYEWQNLLFSQQLKYNFYDQDTFYEPIFESSSEIEFIYSRFSSGLSLNYHTGSVSSLTGFYQKDLLMLDLQTSYSLFKNLELILSASDLIDNDYAKYDLDPDYGFRIFGGFNLKF